MTRPSSRIAPGFGDVGYQQLANGVQAGADQGDELVHRPSEVRKYPTVLDRRAQAVVVVVDVIVGHDAVPQRACKFRNYVVTPPAAVVLIPHRHLPMPAVGIPLDAAAAVEAVCEPFLACCFCLGVTDARREHGPWFITARR